VAQSALDSIYKVPDNGRYIFQAPVPQALNDDIQAAAGSVGPSKVTFDFAMHKMPPTQTKRFGEVRIIDSTNFPVSTSIAAVHVVVKPGGLRELHWHQNADEWQYYIAGKGRMTVFFNAAKARTADFNAGDVGYVPKTMGHYVENVGDSDLVFLEMFKTNRFMDLSLSEWISNTPPELVMQHLGLSKEVLQTIPKVKPLIVPV
jgi:oxalate decarboxylase